MKTLNQQNYRICYDNGNATTGIKVYEFQKYCECQNCKIRTSFKREPKNRATVTTKDISKVDEVVSFLEKWSCENGSLLLEPRFYKF